MAAPLPPLTCEAGAVWIGGMLGECWCLCDVGWVVPKCWLLGCRRPVLVPVAHWVGVVADDGGCSCQGRRQAWLL